MESGDKTIEIPGGHVEHIGSLGASEKEIKSSWMIHSGCGMVWTMDWSPHDEEDKVSFLAVGCHPRGNGVHDLNATYSGTNVIQIWNFPDTCIHPENTKDPGTAPRIVMNLVHQGGPTWSLCWCPSPKARTRERMGLLAGVLGDGSICIWSIPTVFDEGTSCCLRPVAYLGKDHVDGSIPCTVDWLPHEPHDLLLIGYRDGCVSILKLVDDEHDNMQAIQYFPAEVLALKSAKWFPKQDDGCCVNGIERHVFVTSGYEGGINIWDSRFEYSPRVSVGSNTAFTVNDICWTSSPMGIIGAMEDGSIRAYLMDATAVKNQLSSGRPVSVIGYRGKLPGGMCALGSSVPSKLTRKGLQTIAYGGEDGVIGILGNPNYPYVSRKRKSIDIPLVGLWGKDDGRFKLVGTQQLQDWQPNGGLYHGASEDRKKVLKDTKGKLTNISQAIYSIAWSHRPTETDKTHGQWLAYGNVHGIIHCLWVPSLPGK